MVHTMWCVVCEPPAAVVELCSHQGCRPANCTLLLAMMSMMMTMVMAMMMVDSMTVREIGMVVMTMVMTMMVMVMNMLITVDNIMVTIVVKWINREKNGKENL